MKTRERFVFVPLLMLGSLATVFNVAVLNAGSTINNVPCGKSTNGIALNAGTRFSTDCNPCYWTYCTGGDYNDACDGNYCSN